MATFSARRAGAQHGGDPCLARSRLALCTLFLAAGCAGSVEDVDEPAEIGAAHEPTIGEEGAPRLLPDFWDDFFGLFAGNPGSDPDPTPPPPVSGGGTSPPASALPRVNGPCPELRDGWVTVGGAWVALTVGSQRGPMVFYWHGTGTDSSEVEIGLPGATDEIKRSGGIVASFEDSSGLGDNTGDYWWFTGDIDAADQILACGVQAGLVDPARIHAAGYSAGGLQTGTMVFSRSGYLASAVVYSGGPALGGLVPGSTWFADPSNIPSVLGAHGAAGSDWLALDFAEGTQLVGDTVRDAGGYAIDCDDGGDHEISWILARAGVGGMAWQFLKDHPYKARPASYASSLPFGFPSYCAIVR
jgi:hypothetical protein